MNDSADPLHRRDFLKALGVLSLPVLTQGCDPEQAEALEFRAGPPKSKGSGSKSGTTTVQVSVAKALLEQDLLLGSSQYCSIPASLGSVAPVGSQVRITNFNNDNTALYTVAELRNEPVVRMSLAARGRVESMQAFDGSLSTRLTANLSDGAAESQNEFVERVVNRSDRVLVLGCHGGAIEYYTDMQAERVTAKLAGLGASSWICKGWNERVGAFKAWHINSTDIRPASFPGLYSITSNRDYQLCTSFHGSSDITGVLIGGLAPLSLKSKVAYAIRSAVNDEYEVAIATAEDLFNADHPNNVVNAFTSTPGGVQLEQCLGVRSKYWEAIADAIADVFAQEL